jgi:hypothetical protein
MSLEATGWSYRGARTAQLALAAGVLDEPQIHLIPVLLGQGRPLFDHLGPHHRTRAFGLGRATARPPARRRARAALARHPLSQSAIAAEPSLIRQTHSNANTYQVVVTERAVGRY